MHECELLVAFPEIRMYVDSALADWDALIKHL